MILGIPLDYSEYDISQALIADGYEFPKEMSWGVYSDLYYLKLTYPSREIVEKLLNHTFCYKKQPLIILPKIDSKNPISMLADYEVKLKIDSVEPESKLILIYEFLLKFGAIVDLEMIDNHNIYIMFVNPKSKYLLQNLYGEKTVLFDQNQNIIKLEFYYDISPVILKRKHVYQTLLHYYEEAKLMNKQTINNCENMSNVVMPNKIMKSKSEFSKLACERQTNICENDSNISLNRNIGIPLNQGVNYKPQGSFIYIICDS